MNHQNKSNRPLVNLRHMDADALARWVTLHAGHFTHAEETALADCLAELQPQVKAVA